MNHRNAWTSNVFTLVMFFFASTPLFALEAEEQKCKTSLIRTGKILTRVRSSLGGLISKQPKTQSIHSETLSNIELHIDQIGFPGVLQVWDVHNEKASTVLNILEKEIQSIKDILNDPLLTRDDQIRIQTLKAKIANILNFFLNDRTDLIERGSSLSSKFESIYKDFNELPSLEIGD